MGDILEGFLAREWIGRRHAVKEIMGSMRDAETKFPNYFGS